MKISFIGSGSVASSTAFISGLSGLFDNIVMLDIFENFAKGKAIDLQQGFILYGKDIKVIGTLDYNEVRNSDVIVISAGVADKSGVSNREALLTKNKEIIKEIALKLIDIVEKDVKQPLIIMVTNPIDNLLKYFIDIGNFNKQKTVGSGNWLDSARFKYYLAKELKIKESEIETFVAGQHGEKMVYLLSQTKIKNKPLFDYIKDNDISIEKINKICQETTKGSQEIIGLLEKEGTVFGPAISVFNIIESYIKNLKRMLSLSVYCNGEYNIDNYCVGYPVFVGKNGVEEFVKLDLNENEIKSLKESYEFIKNLDKE